VIVEACGWLKTPTTPQLQRGLSISSLIFIISQKK